MKNINVVLYKLNTDNLGDIGLISQAKYKRALGLSTDYLYKIFNNKAEVKLITAKSMISLAYNISVRDSEQMEELLQKHFTLLK